MEYQIPVDRGIECLDEMLQVLRDYNVATFSVQILVFQR